ncbi:hypothetical protein [Demequina sp. NBRC 110055]|uniref:hypothetical protein n=1 Tax=Demequina sp. NBRC 110055 TaxID=1570344 RepID=UPI000A02C4DB|nr:hypothetical protein [Demequina sp. NBRC 110055]
MSKTLPRIGHRVGVRDRDPSYLAEGPLGDIATWHHTLRLDAYDSPSFVWPRDRAWCNAWDLDPHDPATKAPYYY